jgi:hypothetical protein
MTQIILNYYLLVGNICTVALPIFYGPCTRH